MTTSPDQIRRDIERTRSELSDNVNALGDKVSPGSIARRQRDKVRDAASGVKNAVMGSAADAKQASGETASSLKDSVADAPNAVARRAQGSPIAAGLIAFGAGLLVSSLLPASRVEQRAAETVKEQAEPLVSEITEAAKDSADRLKEPAQQAVASVKDSAVEAADLVKADSTEAIGDVKDQAQDAKDTVQHSAG